MFDAYAVLGIPETASAAEIKSAFKKTARRTHPDVNHAPNAEAAFKAVAKAYEILSDPAMRRRHDQERKDARRPRCRTCGAPVAYTGKRCATCQRGRRQQYNDFHNADVVTTAMTMVQNRGDPGSLDRQFRPYDSELYSEEQNNLEARYGHLGWWTKAGMPRWNS